MQALVGDGQLVLLGDETEQYEWEPSCLYVLRHAQRNYVRRPALVESVSYLAETNVITAPEPRQPIAAGSVGPPCRRT